MAWMSVLPPIRGSGSIFQSPVCRMVPNGVLIATPFGSGIEWEMVISCISNGPSVILAVERHHRDRHLIQQPGVAQLLSRTRKAVNGVA